MSKVQTAIKIAHDSLKSLFPEAQKTRLEEVEFEEQNDSIWMVTLSFIESKKALPKFIPEDSALRSENRIYKIFKVDIAHPQMIAMKIRELA
jgi:hypothetical protein